MQNEWCQLPEFLREAKEVKNVVKSPHHHLKIVKFSGFYGRTNDREMVSYILENCVVLSKLIIDPKRERPCNTSDVEQFARNNANQQLQVPAHVELVILWPVVMFNCVFIALPKSGGLTWGLQLFFFFFYAYSFYWDTCYKNIVIIQFF